MFGYGLVVLRLRGQNSFTRPKGKFLPSVKRQPVVALGDPLRRGFRRARVFVIIFLIIFVTISVTKRLPCALSSVG